MNQKVSAKLLLILVACSLTAGCSTAGPHSSLDPAGTQAQKLASLWWLFLWICLGVYVITMIVTLAAAFRDRWPSKAEPGPADVRPDPARERSLHRTVAGAVTATAVLLFVLLAADVLTARSVHALAGEEADPVIVKLTGHQWWWEVQYSDPIPSNVATTANEVHLPAGRVVKFEIRSSDVIHSIWIPNLHGKKDLIPGHDTSLWVKADRVGNYVGECAEFCGLQHAKMRLNVVVETPEQFAAWLSAQRKLAEGPQSESAQRGRQVFMTSSCVMCHTIAGTPAGGRVGPDLTHLASRPTLAAGALPNTRGHLGGWVIDPQSAKPGVRMPQNNLRPTDLRDLLDYLYTLK